MSSCSVHIMQKKVRYLYFWRYNTNPDIIFVFGGTNDAWANSPVGEYQFSDWTKDDCKSFRPALACLLDMLKKQYPKAEIYSILNSELNEDVNESMREVCKHYGVHF